MEIRYATFLAVGMAIFASVTVTAQTPVQRYVYELKFQPDSTNETVKTKEIFYLDVTPEVSRFVSITKLGADKRVDSITKSMEQKSAMGGGMQNMSINFSGSSSRMPFAVIKEANGNLQYQERVRIADYYYQENNIEFNWVIKEEAVNYNGMQCQVATCNYGGRTWTAYFAPSIPLNEGPYKFRGLPGLIVKIVDAKNQYVFEMIASKKENVMFDIKPSGKASLLSKADFWKLKDNSRNASLLADIPAGAKVMLRDKDGNEINMDDLKKRMADAAKKNNNPIELSL